MQDIGMLLDKIELDKDLYPYFLGGKIVKIRMNRKLLKTCFVLNIPKMLPVSVFKPFYDKLVYKYGNEQITTKDMFGDEVKKEITWDISCDITYDEINKDYIGDYYKYICENTNTSLKIFKNNNIYFDDNIKIEVLNKFEYTKLNSNIDIIKKNLNNYGFKNDVDVVINEEKASELKKIIKEDTIKIEKKEIKESNIIFGNDIKDEVNYKLTDVIGEEANIVVDTYIFGVDAIETPKVKIITLKISDETDSIYCKMFVREKDEYDTLLSKLKNGMWIRVKGSVKYDTYQNSLVLNARDIIKIEHEKVILTDDATEKRVELHAHTMMSLMDGVTKLDLGKHTCELVTNAINMGYKGVAITDHDGCQAFPIAYSLVSSYNKGKEDKDKFKCLYGVELTLVDDVIESAIRVTDDSLIDTTYVVFDTETTGLDPTSEELIEIGAVKLKNGEIIDRFDELIKPSKSIPELISNLTNITNDMVKDCDTDLNVLNRFLKWAGNLPLVAHNAKFDISFLEETMKRYDLGTLTNTVIDTLKLDRALDPGIKKRKLNILAEKYGVVFNEDEHHRADYDAEGTALVFDKMIKKLDNQNKEKISDLNDIISKDDIHKVGDAYHFNAIALNKKGLKNLFKIISLANTEYYYREPRILRSKLNELRDGLLIGSGCYESEVFREARNKDGEELSNIINFYDYVEVQPIDVYSHLIDRREFNSEYELKEHIKKIINSTKSAGKIIVATGDVHHFHKEDKIYREIIVNQKVPGRGRHPLCRKEITSIPSQHYRTTNEMLDNFDFLDEESRKEIVITNPNKILDMADFIEVIIDTGGIPFSPRVKADDGLSYLDCPRVVTDLVFERAKEWYGNPLPYNIEERISKELYGDIVYTICNEKIKEENKDIGEEEIVKETFLYLHNTLVSGFDKVKELLKDYLTKKWTSEDGEFNDSSLEKKMKKSLGGIIGGGFDPIYLIAQRLVKHSNDEGFLVGSRGSVGSSFVATMMGITEVNPLPAHYRCLECKMSIFDDEDGALGKKYSTGFDLPDKECPHCHTKMYKDGQDMPFATFLGFNADKVPDIDLNFSDLNQASAHAYTKVLFGEDNVYRAGTISTVAEKTAFGYVKGYFEEKGITKRLAEVERLAVGCTGVKRTTGQHPGGIVVIPDYMEVFDFTPFQYPAEDITSPWRTTHFDYHAIDQCVLKLDILGHSDPTQLRMIQEITKTDVTQVPLDDKDTMSLFTSTKALGVKPTDIMCEVGALGVPEFGTALAIRTLLETKPTTFGELIKLSGLSHGTGVWGGNAQDLVKNKIVPFEQVIGCRDDIMVYLMNNGLPPIKAFKIMEFVRKGKAKKDPTTWEDHKNTMREYNIPDWYIDSCGKIEYMFPKAHAAAYVISAFRIAWYKVHMPSAFYASWLSSKATDVDVEVMIKGYDAIKDRIIDIQNKIAAKSVTNKEEGQLESLRVALEASARGIKFLPVDLYESESTTWKVKSDNEIYPPFNSIDGLGETVAKNIVNERKKEFMSIEDVQNRAKVSQTLIDKMRTMNIFKNMPETSQLSLFDL